MPYYGDDLIERVREASDIVDVISEYLPLKRKGRNYWAKCPFHQEKTGSFSVSPDKQIFHCFGCQKGGNVFTFIMEYEKLPFPEALKLLAGKANIDLPQQQFRKESKEIEHLYYAHEVAAEFFTDNLKNSRKTLEYLRKRKLKDETIETFKLGYALDNWEALLKHAKSKSLTETDLEKAGLIVRSDKDTLYDRFRDRLVFTIFNTAKKPIAFGARTFKKEEQAKYINSPETPLYHKTNILYGLSHSRGEIRRAESAIVVEGYFDYLSLYQAGIKNVVASSGTAFTAEQASLLARSASTAILMFDSDSAGQKAAIRSVDYLFEAGVEVRVVSFPKGEDPDSIIHAGGAELMEQYLSKAQSFVEYSLSVLPEKYEDLSLGMKDKAIKRLTTLAARLDDPVRRELFLQEISKHYRIDQQALKRSVKPSSMKPPEKPAPQKSSKLEEDFIALLLTNADLLDLAVKEVADSDLHDELLSNIYNMIVAASQQGNTVDAATLIDKAESQTIKETIARLAATDLGKGDPIELFNDCLTAFKKRNLKQKLDNLIQALNKAEQEKDQESIAYYEGEINRLSSEK